MNVKKLKQKLLEKPKTRPRSRTDYLSSGCTLLNLGCTGKYYGAFIAGKMHLLVGDSSSGKTALSLTCLAEASINPDFDKYELVLDDAEGGAMFNIEKMFPRLSKRLKVENSATLEGMYYTIDDYLSKKKPFIYVVDSMDVLDTDEDQSKFKEQKNAFKKGKNTAGTYGTSKAKLNSTNIRRLMTPLRDSGSILIMISQTRDNLGFGFEKKTRAGGRALRFYATLEIWSSIKSKIKKTVKGKPRVIGIESELRIKKNRVTGQDCSVIVPIYYSHGFDDVGSMVDYMLSEGTWTKRGSTINAPELDFSGTQEKLIQYIEKQKLQIKLQKLVSKTWHEIEDESKVKRVSRYA